MTDSVLEEIWEQSSDFFWRYNKIRISDNYDMPGVGITESEFNAWPSKVESWLIHHQASIEQLHCWHRVSSISSYDDEYF